MNKEYRIQQTSKFKKKLKLMIKRRLPIDELREVVTKLQNDWLLEYKKNEKTLILILIDTGSHSDLFKT